MATAADIAEAVKVALAGGSFSQSFTPTREYLPAYDLKDLKTLTVAVVAKSLTDEMVTRGDAQREVRVDIGVMKKLTSLAAETVDPLVALVEEIAQSFRKANLTAGAATAVWLRTEIPDLYLHEHMNEHRQFTSVVTLTYRVVAAT